MPKASSKRKGQVRTSDGKPLRAQAGRICGTGGMADLTRAHNWSQTSVGPIERWSDALLVVVNTLLESRHPMFLWWGDDLVQFYNDAYRKSLGHDKHPRALGQRGKECWPEIWPVIGPQIQQVMQQGKATWSENQLIPIFRNGNLEDVYWTYGYSPVRDSGQNICGTLVVCTETTKTHLSEQNLRSERARLAELFQQAPAFFTLLRGPDHIFEMINPLYQELLGPRNLLGRPVREAVPEAEGQGYFELLDAVYQTGMPRTGRGTKLKLARGDSDALEERFIDFVYQPMRDPDGTVVGIIVLGVDVTESKRAEQALLQSEKLAAVGRLASSIAHEINNPLESVMNLLYLAQETTSDSVVQEYLRTADRELRRVSAIAHQTLRFHRQSTDPVCVRAEDLIESTLSIYHGKLLNARVEVELRDRASISILCFDGEIRQVLSNLVNNAVDAMKVSGGRLLVRSQERTRWKTGEQGLAITVADTGSGMSPDTLAKIFQPFYTTKGFAGTGLGLWVSSGIADRHKGTLQVRSAYRGECTGTVFVLFLPSEAMIR